MVENNGGEKSSMSEENANGPESYINLLNLPDWLTCQSCDPELSTGMIGEFVPYPDRVRVDSWLARFGEGKLKPSRIR